MNHNKEAKKGVQWTSLSTAVLALTQILKISVLTRFLDKFDFGIVAIILFVLGFCNLFLDLGLSVAILHKQNITKDQYSSLYWLNLIIASLIFLFLFAVSPFIASFYDEPILVTLLPITATTIIISAFGRQFKTIKQKDLKFKFIAINESTGNIISLLVAILLVVLGYGIYSLIVSVIVQFFVINIVYFAFGIKKNPIKFHFLFYEARPFLNIGLFQSGGQIVNYFNRDIDILLVGKMLGAEQLGYYTLAKQLVFRPVQLINPVITTVASPILSRLQTNRFELKKNYLQLLNIVSTINIPIYLFIILFAPVIVKILYGNEYLPSVDAVRILSIYMIFRGIGNPLGSLVIATGKTKLEFYWNLLVLTIMPIAILIGSQYSISAVAYSLLLVIILLFIPSWRLLIFNLINASLREFLESAFIIRPKMILSFFRDLRFNRFN